MTNAPRHIVSGGQTGVDRGALDAALALGMFCGGWCPAERRAEDGPIPDRYPVVEMKDDSYAARTRANVRDSDATLILVLDEPLTGGTALTRDIAIELERPLLILSHPWSEERLAEWLNSVGPDALNIAGPRESGAPGIGRAAQEWLILMLTPRVRSDRT